MAVLTLGCRDASPTQSTSSASPPHGGSTFALPGDRGYVEILSRVAGQVRGKRPNTEISIYFLKPDMSTPLEPAPSEVKLTLNLPEGAKTVPLSRQQEADKQGPAFVSKPGQYGGGNEMMGEVAATIQGESVVVPFTIR